jgi:hypothetical protein
MRQQALWWIHPYSGDEVAVWNRLRNSAHKQGGLSNFFSNERFGNASANGYVGNGIHAAGLKIVVANFIFRQQN